MKYTVQGRGNMEMGSTWESQWLVHRIIEASLYTYFTSKVMKLSKQQQKKGRFDHRSVYGTPAAAKRWETSIYHRHLRLREPWMFQKLEAFEKCCHRNGCAHIWSFHSALLWNKQKHRVVEASYGGLWNVEWPLQRFNLNIALVILNSTKCLAKISLCYKS